MGEAFTVVVEKDVPLTTRDGTVLRSDVYRPADSGRYPVLLGRTQYGKETWAAWIPRAHGGPGLRRLRERHARPVRVRGRVRPVPLRRRGQLRRGGMVRGPALVE